MHGRWATRQTKGMARKLEQIEIGWFHGISEPEEAESVQAFRNRENVAIETVRTHRMKFSLRRNANWQLESHCLKRESVVIAIDLQTKEESMNNHEVKVISLRLMRKAGTILLCSAAFALFQVAMAPNASADPIVGSTLATFAVLAGSTVTNTGRPPSPEMLVSAQAVQSLAKGQSPLRDRMRKVQRRPRVWLRLNSARRWASSQA